MDTPQQIADLREQLAHAMPQAIADTNIEQKAQFIAQLEQLVSQRPTDQQAEPFLLEFEALLRACIAILRGEPFDVNSVAPADKTQLQMWHDFAQASPEQHADLQQQTQQQQIEQIREDLANAIPQAITDKDPQRKAEFTEQISHLAQQIEADEDSEPAWHSFVALVKAGEAILREQEYETSSLLPDDLALVQAWQDWANTSPEQRAAIEREREIQQIAQFRAELTEAMPQAVVDTSRQRKSQYIEQLEQVANQTTDPAGTPWHALAALLRACVALLRGQSYDTSTLSAEDLTQIQAWQAQADAHIQQHAEEITQVTQQHIAKLRSELEQVMPDTVASGDLERLEVLAEHFEQAHSQIPTVGIIAPLWTEFAALLVASIAVLRGQGYDPATLSATDLTQIQTWQAQVNATLAQNAEAQEQQLLQNLQNLRGELKQTMPYAIIDTDAERKQQYIDFLEEMLETANANTEANSPFREFAAMLIAYLALLRGQNYDPTTLSAQDLAQIQAWQTLDNTALEQGMSQ
jgi:hypothetical protein